MTFNLRTSSVILIFLLLNSSCNSSTEKKKSEASKSDTITIEHNDIAIPVKIVLKEIVLNERAVITGNRLSASKKMDGEVYKLLSVKMIDSTAGDETGFRYHIIDTLLSDHGIKVLLIGREYESENFIWITVYDDQNKLLDHRTVYYDNAEGFLSIETIIKNNQLGITTFNEYAEQEKGKKTTAVYHLDENNRFVKL